MTARTGSSTRRGRGDQGTFHCAGPHRSLPSAPRTAEPKPEPEPEPEPSQLRAAAPVAACVSPLPENHAGLIHQRILYETELGKDGNRVVTSDSETELPKIY